MKMNYMKILTTVSLALALAMAVGCDKEAEEAFTFDINGDAGTELGGTQTFFYDEARAFPVSSEGVSKVEFTTPAGWDAYFAATEKKIHISSPAGDNTSAAENGVVKIDVTSYDRRTLTRSINVSVTDASVEFTLDGVAEGLNMKYAQTMNIPASLSNVWSIESTAPKGWTVVFDREGCKVDITAPALKDETAEHEGTITVTPVSKRGTLGSPVSFSVQVLASAPVLKFEADRLERVAHGSTSTMKSVEYANIDKVTITNVPAGWNVDLQKGDNEATLTVTAPSATAEGFTGSGTVRFDLTSDTGETGELELPVSMLGINDADDFLAFAEAYMKGGDCSLWKDGGEVVVNSDIDLTGTPKSLYVNAGFSGVFNGANHTITYRIESNSGDAGIFQTVKGDGTVKNLKIAGTFNITDGNDRAGGIAAYSNGATFENVISTVKYTQTQIGNTRQGTMIGGLVGDETAGGTYRNCHVRGNFSLVAVMFFGGLIADVWDNDGLEIYDCSNESDVTISTNKIGLGNAWFGGILGKSDGAGVKMYRTYNTGNIKADFGGGKTNFAGLGGIAGYACGYYEDCYNAGDIIFTNGADKKGNGNVGGLAGAVRVAKGKMLVAKNCYNKGTVKAIGDAVGGFIGLIRDGGEGSMKLTGCRNEGTVDCRSEVAYSASFGGLMGTVYNSLEMTDCHNKGKVMGYTTQGGAGLIGRGADNIVITKCTNSANVYVGSHASVKADKPYAAGLVCGFYPTIQIKESANTGDVFAMVRGEGYVSNVFTSVQLNTGNTDASTVDEATVNASKASKVTIILPEKWTDTLPEEWTK